MQRLVEKLIFANNYNSIVFFFNFVKLIYLSHKTSLCQLKICYFFCMFSWFKRNYSFFNFTNIVCGGIPSNSNLFLKNLSHSWNFKGSNVENAE